MSDAQKKKPTAGFWITVALIVVLVLYAWSFGPACWISSHLGLRKSVGFMYQPMMHIW